MKTNLPIMKNYRINRIAILLLLVISIWQTPMFSQISGTKTIGSGGDYTTFTQAAEALNTLGVNGPVVFNVISGTYTEQFTINNITGSSAANTVIFQSQAGDSTAVVLQWTSSGTADNYVVTINGGKYITFRGMTFKAMGTSYGKLVELKGYSGNILFNYNQFLGLEANDATNNKTILSGVDKNLTNIIVRNNRFINGSQAVYLEGYNDKFITGCEITDNIMINCGFAGVRTNWVFSAVVTGNEIDSKENGIYVRSERGNGNYSCNTIKAEYAGIDLQHIEASALKTRIYNNFISVSNTNAAFGITIPNTVTTEIFNNSVCVHSNYKLSAAFRAESGTAVAGVVVKNNNFACTNMGYALYIITPAALSDISYNNLYSEGNFIALWGSEDIADLYDLHTVSGMNEHSLSVYPHFVSINDLHSIAPWLDGKGTVIPGINDDIDGDPRDPANPDIGADEFVSDPEYQTKLSGTYTIGSNGYYKDFSTALNDALLRGISGPVVYDIQSGSYNEQIKIRNIPGSGSVNTVTFRSETGNYGDVLLYYAATAAYPNYVISLRAADFIHLKNVSVQATGSTYARVLDLSQGCDSIVIENNYLEGKIVNDGTDKAYIINADSNYFRSRIIKGNVIKNGSYGIYMRRELNDDLHLKGAVIEDNNISGSGYCGIYLQFHDAPLIYRNTVSARGRGIYLIDCTGPAIITENKISSAGNEGINLTLCAAATNNRGLIANNFIQAGGYSDTKGISLTGTEFYSVLYNNINITGTSLSAIAFQITTGATGVIVKNNIFSNKYAYTISVANSASVAESDYNDFYSAGPGPFAYWGGTGFADLASLTAASGMDLHSISADPLFVSDTDLHTTAAQLDGKATPVTEVRKDIDGRRRDALYPDIGAAEFGPIANYWPVAVNDTVAALSKESIIIDVLANDSDPDGDNIIITAVRSPKHGQAVVVQSGLELSYTSSPGYVGADSCIYIISDDFGFKDSAYVFIDVEPLPLFSLTDIEIIDLSHSSVAWGDYDNDGDLDLLITGWLGTYDNYASRIYKNTDGKFTDSGIVLAGVSSGTSHSAEWMDLDNDNDLDIIITGRLNNSSLITKTLIYVNTGGKFTESDQPELINLSEGSVDWSDFNHDGRYDLLISGGTGAATYYTRIYENSGPDGTGSWKLKLHDAELEGIWSGESMWVDFDTDGEYDIFVCGFEAEPAKLYHNNDGVFTSLYTNLPSVGNAACDWGDYDNDGDMDLALIGKSEDTYLTKIYRNDGFVGKVYTFTDIGAGIVQVSSGDIAWGDYDNDGDLDIVFTGNTGALTSVTKLYENANGLFVEKSTPFRDIGRSTLAWGDYDGDKDIDLVISGYSPSLNRPFTAVYRNNHDLAGQLPLAPIKLNAELQSDESVLLSWEPADAGFGKNSGPLTFNLRIGTEPGETDIFSPLADPETGDRKIVKSGNTGLSGSWLVSGLTGGQKYYWSVQSVDMSFRGSEFAGEDTFVVPYNYSLAGQIWDGTGTNPILKSVVVLYHESDISDTTQLRLDGVNSYLFTGLSPAKYTVRVIPDRVTYPEKLPTYLGDNILMYNATWVTVAGPVTGKDIRLIDMPQSVSGPYMISGKMIIDFGGKGVTVTEKSGDIKGVPAQGAAVFLTGAADGKLKSWDITGADGSFEFSNLAEGSYYFLADCQGKPMDAANPVLAVSDARKSIEILATVGSDKITVTDLSTGIDDRIMGGLKVYPVPADDHIFLEVSRGIFKGSSVRISILDLSGKYVLNEKVSDLSGNPVTLNIAGLPEGVYVLRLTDNKISYNLRIIKVR